MDSIFLQIAKSSPLLALMLIFWYFQRNDYKNFIDKVQDQNAEREKKYQITIDTLTEKMRVIENVQIDVKEIKNHIFNEL